MLSSYPLQPNVPFEFSGLKAYNTVFQEIINSPYDPLKTMIYNNFADLQKTLAKENYDYFLMTLAKAKKDEALYRRIEAEQAQHVEEQIAAYAELLKDKAYQEAAIVQKQLQQAQETPPATSPVNETTMATVAALYDHFAEWHDAEATLQGLVNERAEQHRIEVDNIIRATFDEPIEIRLEDGQTLVLPPLPAPTTREEAAAAVEEREATRERLQAIEPTVMHLERLPHIEEAIRIRAEELDEIKRKKLIAAKLAHEAKAKAISSGLASDNNAPDASVASTADRSTNSTTTARDTVSSATLPQTTLEDTQASFKQAYNEITRNGQDEVLRKVINLKPQFGKRFNRLDDKEQSKWFEAFNLVKKQSNWNKLLEAILLQEAVFKNKGKNAYLAERSDFTNSFIDNSIKRDNHKQGVNAVLNFAKEHAEEYPDDLQKAMESVSKMLNLNLPKKSQGKINELPKLVPNQGE